MMTDGQVKKNKTRLIKLWVIKSFLGFHIFYSPHNLDLSLDLIHSVYSTEKNAPWPTFSICTSLYVNKRGTPGLLNRTTTIIVNDSK
jgi:hypothetical protein